MSSQRASVIPEAGTDIGEYRVLREIGRGGMATILEVAHRETEELLAIKLMLPGGHTEEVVQRFHLEFDILARLDHPGIMRVHATDEIDGRPYIVMELLDGQELGAVVESWKELPPTDRFEQARTVLVSVAKALEYVHGQGLVHRDVTPSNIMVLRDGSVRLMDFGVVKEPGADLTSVGEVVGTVAYIAPEQINGTRVDARTDLYSLGAVFYLMLTGKRPFTARTLAGYLDKHLHRPVRPPRELVPTVPLDLNEICMRLLAKAPSDRYGSASHLLHVMDEKAESDDLSSHRSWDPGMVGRAGEIAQVREAVARLAVGTGGVLLLESSYGMGRSALAREAIAQAERFGLSTSIGRSTAPDQRAFESYRVPYEALVHESTSPTALEVAFGGRTTDDATLEKWTVFSAFRNLILNGGPHLLVLDDLDRGDRGSIEMTEYLIRNLIGDSGDPLLLVITREPPHDLDPLKELLDGDSTGVEPELIRLGPLSVGAVEELLLSMVRDEPRARKLASRLHREGEGVPFFIREMIRGLIDQGVIKRGKDGARGSITIDAQSIAASTLPVPASIRDAIKDRLTPMGDLARSLVGVLAVARQEMDTELLCMATLMDTERVLLGMEQLINAGLVRERHLGETERFELAQNRLKDVVLEEIGTDQRRTYHRRIGEALERKHRRRVSYVVESLAYHFEQGGVAPKAYPYLVLAADKLMQRTFVGEALEYLDRAFQIESDAREYMILDDADRRLAGLHLKRARALYHLGRWSESTAELVRADELAKELADAEMQIGVATEMGCQRRRVRDLPEAETYLKTAIDLAREHGHRKMEILPLYEMGGVAWARGDLESARDWWVEGLARSEQFNDETRLAWGYGGLGLLAMCKGQSAEARRKLEQAIEVCERHGLMERLTVARINLVELYHYTGNFRKGLQISDQAVTQAREVRYRYGVGLAMRYRTLVLTDIGRHGEAMENALASLRIHQEMGNREEELSSLVVACRAGLAQGAYEEVEPMLDAAMVLAQDYDTEGFLPILLAWCARVCAVGGRMDEACDALERSMKADGRPWPGQRVRSNLNLARATLLLDARTEAMKFAEEALRLSDASGYRHYAMRARNLIIQCADDDVVIARHHRVAEALARSLAANLSREDASAFLAMHGVAPRVTLA